MAQLRTVFLFLELNKIMFLDLSLFCPALPYICMQHGQNKNRRRIKIIHQMDDSCYLQTFLFSNAASLVAAHRSGLENQEIRFQIIRSNGYIAHKNKLSKFPMVSLGFVFHTMTSILLLKN